MRPVHMKMILAAVPDLKYGGSKQFNWSVIVFSLYRHLSRPSTPTVVYLNERPIPVVALFVPRQLHRPLKALAADVAPFRFERQVRAADVIAQRLGIAQVRAADVACELFTVLRRLLHDRIAKVLDHRCVPRPGTLVKQQAMHTTKGSSI